MIALRAAYSQSAIALPDATEGAQCTTRVANKLPPVVEALRKQMEELQVNAAIQDTKREEMQQQFAQQIEQTTHELNVSIHTVSESVAFALGRIGAMDTNLNTMAKLHRDAQEANAKAFLDMQESNRQSLAAITAQIAKISRPRPTGGNVKGGALARNTKKDGNVLKNTAGEANPSSAAGADGLRSKGNRKAKEASDMSDDEDEEDMDGGLQPEY